MLHCKKSKKKERKSEYTVMLEAHYNPLSSKFLMGSGGYIISIWWALWYQDQYKSLYQGSNLLQAQHWLEPMSTAYWEMTQVSGQVGGKVLKTDLPGSISNEKGVEILPPLILMF
jgi:hypothetical protein